MKNVEARLAKLEQQVAQHVSRNECSQCGPTWWLALFEEDGRLIDTVTGERWPTDADGHPLCKACGRRAQLVMIISERK